MIDDSRTRYGSISRLFHWSMAVLVFWQLLKLGDRIDEGEHWIGETLVPWHISIGATILVLVILRGLWARKQIDKRPLQDPAIAFIVNAGHVLLYAGMVLLPITGVFYMIGEGHGLEIFGVKLAEKAPEIAWMQSIGAAHSYLAWAMLALVLGHIGAALWHAFVKRDDVLQRML